MLNMHDDEKIMPKEFGGKENLLYLCSVLLKWYTNTVRLSTNNTYYDRSKEHQFQVCRIKASGIR